jgi:hypothetical protein
MAGGCVAWIRGDAILRPAEEEENQYEFDPSIKGICE